MRPVLMSLLIASAFGLGACGGSDGSAPDEAAAPGTTAPTTAAGTTATSPAGTTASDEPATIAEANARLAETLKTKQGVCKSVAASHPKSNQVSKPTGSLDPSKTYYVRMKTNCGVIKIQLDQKNNPITANAFAHLAQTGFYAGTRFHRIVKDFVIQGGDPTGTGTGGPPWSVVEAPPKNEKYPQGTVAMAKTGDEPAGTSGSQFFIVTGKKAGLTPDYAVAGKVVKGLNVALAMEKHVVPNTEIANTPLRILSATVSSK